ncbi:MAG TPA: hypothetical protein VFZ41_02965, partial [Solirubrobacterales bacterium]
TDPDSFVQREGREGYLAQLREAVPYLEFLLRRAATAHDLGTDQGRRAFLHEMLTVAARIPDPAARDQFADRLAARARITESVVREEIRKAAAARRVAVPERVLAATSGGLKPAERGLIWALMNQPEAARAALEQLEPDDLEHLAARPVLELARGLQEFPAEQLPGALLERLTDQERPWVAALAAEPHGPALSAEDCARTLQRLRFDREREALQREIDRLQDGLSAEAQARLTELSLQKIALKRRIEALSAS